MSKDDFVEREANTFDVKVGITEILIGGVIADVGTPDQAKIAEEAGVLAVRISGSVVDPILIESIQEAVSIPVIAKCRIGHFLEAQVLEALFVDFIDESESLPRADNRYFIDKRCLKIPFTCGSSHLASALCRIAEGVAFIRTEENSLATTVDILRTIAKEVAWVSSLRREELLAQAVAWQAPYHLLEQVAKNKYLPVPLFASGGIVTPADAALVVQLGAAGIFVGHEIFSKKDPKKELKLLVSAVCYSDDPEVLAKLSVGELGDVSASYVQYGQEEILAPRGW